MSSYSNHSHLESTSTQDFFFWGPGGGLGSGAPINPFTSHTYRYPNKDSLPGGILPASPARLTCAGSAEDRRPTGARRGRCHVLTHPAGGRASPDRPTSPRAGGLARRPVRGMLGGARGGCSGSAGSPAGRPGRGEKRSAPAFPRPGRPGRPGPPGRVAHLRPVLGSTGPAAPLFIRPDLGPGALARPGPHAPSPAALPFPARPRPARPTSSGPHPPGTLPASQPLGARFRPLSHSACAQPDHCLRRDLPFFLVARPTLCACAPGEWAGF